MLKSTGFESCCTLKGWKVLKALEVLKVFKVLPLVQLWSEGDGRKLTKNTFLKEARIALKKQVQDEAYVSYMS